MTSLWRRRGRGRSHAAGKRDGQKTTNSTTELNVPTHFRCPISLHLMKDPVSLATGITYDREFIETWIDTGHATCPVSNQVLRNSDRIPNHTLRKMIQDWCVQNKSHGVERIPTPRVPLTPYEVTELRSGLATATGGRDESKCLELLIKVKDLAKESDRNRQCLVKNGIAATLAETFDSFARFSVEKCGNNLLHEVLSALTWSFPLRQLGISRLRSTASLRCMAKLINGGDLSSRRSAILVLKELVVSDESRGSVNGLMEIDGVEEALLRAVRVPICPRATQACLVIIHRMMLSEDPMISSRFVRMGLMDLVLEILVDGSKGICEKALVVLDEICSTEEGRESACRHALAVPILVKKILRVSETATELCVSSLWKVCVGVGGECGDGVVEALRVGGFQKLLVVLQVGCDEGMKKKVSELLRVMNLYRGNVECFDSSMGFNYIKT